MKNSLGVIKKYTAAACWNSVCETASMVAATLTLFGDYNPSVFYARSVSIKRNPLFSREEDFTEKKGNRMSTVEWRTILPKNCILAILTWNLKVFIMYRLRGVVASGTGPVRGTGYKFLDIWQPCKVCKAPRRARLISYTAVGQLLSATEHFHVCASSSTRDSRNVWCLWGNSTALLCLWCKVLPFEFMVTGLSSSIRPLIEENLKQEIHHCRRRFVEPCYS